MSKSWYPILNYDQCTACGACLRKCTHVVFKDKGGMIVVVNPEGCVEGCHGGQKLCPVAAISYFGEKTPDIKSGSCCCAESGNNQTFQNNGGPMKIQILGSGCPKCRTLTANTEKAVQDLGIEAEITKVTDIKEIMAFGVMMTPALVVDGVVKSSGHLLSPEQIKKIINP